MTIRPTTSRADHDPTALPVTESATDASEHHEAAGSTDGEPPQARSVQVFVLDTSVLLSDPAAFHRFAEHEVVLPLVVITELEASAAIRNWAGSRGSRCGSSTICGSSTGGWTSRARQ